jgi:glycosyltransferase involved in cell wall biosynthesis
MKVLIFIQSLGGGGAERVAVNLANEWSRGGTQVLVATLASAADDAYPLDPGVVRAVLGYSSAAGGPLATLRNNRARVRVLRALLREWQPDAALSMLSNANVVLAMAARGLPRLATVGAERTHPPRMPLGRIREIMRWYWYGRLRAVTALTAEGAHWIAAHTRARTVLAIPNPVSFPLPEAPPIVPVPVSPGRKLLLAAGRLAESKQFGILLDVFAELAPDFPDWDLAIVGAGPEEGPLRAQVAALNLAGRALLPGRAGNIGAWYGAADIFAMTSRYEGFPNTLAEAMAYGVPAVSFDCDTGPRDIIRDRIDGLLVPNGDRARFQAALAELMGDAALRAAFAARASEVRARFGLPRIAAQWLQLFGRLQAGDAA